MSVKRSHGKDRYRKHRGPKKTYFTNCTVTINGEVFHHASACMTQIMSATKALKVERRRLNRRLRKKFTFTADVTISPGMHKIIDAMKPPTNGETDRCD